MAKLMCTLALTSLFFLGALARSPKLVANVVDRDSCEDTDNGATDPYGDTCESYRQHREWCGNYDDNDFHSNEMCCVCGGGNGESCENLSGDVSCNAWLNAGYCEHTYVPWMEINCRKACGVCGGIPDTDDGDETDDGDDTDETDDGDDTDDDDDADEATCTALHSVGSCGQCLRSEQCEEGLFCCPFMKKCVETSSTACYYPIAHCIPPCYNGVEDLHSCTCENEDFPDNWALETCEDTDDTSTDDGGCTEPASFGQCEKCLTSDQCEEGMYCCPYMKKCVIDGSTQCEYPIAECVPSCQDNMDVSTCTCQNTGFPDNWPAPTCGGSTDDGDATGAEAQEAYTQIQLEKHNAYRATHGSQSMTIDADLSADALVWAKYLADNDKWLHDPNLDNQGENLGMSCSSAGYPEYPEVTDSWYSEEKDYDYATGGKTAECEAIGSSCMIGHFTQVVWNGSTKLGCGFAHGTSQGMQCTWAVCRYTPPGNYVGQYVENVGTPTA